MKTLAVPSFAADSAAAASSLFPCRAISLRTAVWSIATGISVVTPLCVGLFILLPPSSRELVEVHRRMLDTVLKPGWIFFVAVVVAPLLEETVFRGWLLTLCRRRGPAWLAVFVSSALFGAIHFSRGLNNMATAFIMGVFFAWLALRTRSLFPAMIAHATFNFASLFLLSPAFGVTQRVLDHGIVATPGQSPWTLLPRWWMLASTLACGVSAFMLARVTSEKSAA